MEETLDTIIDEHQSEAIKNYYYYTLKAINVTLFLLFVK